MENKLQKLIKLVQKLPEGLLDETIDYVEEKIEESTENQPAPPCPHCNSSAKRNGHKDGIQRFRCNTCGKTFAQTTKTALYHSQCGEAVWKQVIRDTLDGVPIAGTAGALALSTDTVFRMRHKILLGLEAEEARNPTVLNGVCEFDDTYVLENLKGGKKLPEGYYRKARRHGAVAQKRGISNEYISISTGIQRDGSAYCRTVARSTPGKDEISAAFDGHIGEATLALCDGAKSYSILGENGNCDVVRVSEENQSGFYHTNTANGLHSHIKEMVKRYKGVATKYLNRYNILFAKMYRSGEDLADSIYNILCNIEINRHHSVKDVTSLRLLDI
jgi:transposase-like protein